MVTFQQAYEAAAARFAPEDWADLSPDLRIKAIYEEMRRLDAEAAGVMDDAHLDERKATRTASESVNRQSLDRATMTIRRTVIETVGMMLVDRPARRSAGRSLRRWGQSPHARPS